MVVDGGEAEREAVEVLREAKERAVRKVFVWRKQRGGSGWCDSMRLLLEDYGLSEWWEEERWEELPGKEAWKKVVHNAVKAREGVDWRKEMARKSSLKVYARVKKELHREEYLRCERSERGSVVLMARLRAGSNALAESQGRKSQTLWNERTCQVCQSGEVEDEYHFLMDCAPLEEQRADMWARVMVSGVEFNKDFGEALKRLTNMGKRDFLFGKRTFFSA